MNFPFVCPDAQSLLNAGAAFAKKCESGNVIALTGGLGMGKTHFAKGFLAGLGSSEVVTSPTFAILQTYEKGRLTVAHLDLYRLKSEDEVLRLGWDELLDEHDVVLVEWADLFPALFPEDTIWLKIEEHDSGRIVRKIAAP